MRSARKRRELELEQPKNTATSQCFRPDEKRKEKLELYFKKTILLDVIGAVWVALNHAALICTKSVTHDSEILRGVGR